jgi:glutamate synthase domain-containing protein 2
MRTAFLLVSFGIFGTFGGLYYVGTPAPIWLMVVVVLLFLLGVADMLQNQQAVKKNFPLIGHFRYMLEAIRPEIQQYFIESNTDGAPINRNDRSVVYQRSKKTTQVLPFGTQEDLYVEGREWLCHSMYSTPVQPGFDRVWVGSRQCEKPYHSSIFNISAMSYGSVSHKAVEALNRGAALGGFYHNTGEGGIADYHRKGADLVWQIGTGYFGCRTLDGDFSGDAFQEKAQWPEVKMIEIKISQGAKPGKGGLLPGAKVTEEIARIRGVRPHRDVVSPSFHKEFSDGPGLLHFVKKLRELSGGKPVGFKLCVGRKDEFLDIIKAIEQTGILPDFINVDGAEGGTGAAPLEFSNAVGMPLKDGLAFVRMALDQAGLTDEVKLIAAGKILTGFHMMRSFALGADIVNSGRGMMLALGCIQALRCHTNHCPVGITTNREDLMVGLHIPSKAQRVANYHEETIKVVEALLSATGKACPRDLNLHDIYQRQGDGTYKTFAHIYQDAFR